MNGSGTPRLLQSELSFWHSSSIIIPIVEWALADSVIGDTHLTSFPSIGSHMPASIITSNAFEKYAAWGGVNGFWPIFVFSWVPSGTCNRWTAPGICLTLWTDKAKISANFLTSIVTVSRSSVERSLPSSTRHKILLTHSGLKGAEEQVNIDLSMPTGISGCSLPGVESSIFCPAESCMTENVFSTSWMVCK